MREVYQFILAAIHGLLGDKSPDIGRSARLEVLKSEGVKDFDKKRQVEEVVGLVTKDMFGLRSHMVQIKAWIQYVRAVLRNMQRTRRCCRMCFARGT